MDGKTVALVGGGGAALLLLLASRSGSSAGGIRTLAAGAGPGNDALEITAEQGKASAFGSLVNAVTGLNVGLAQIEGATVIEQIRSETVLGLGTQQTAREVELGRIRADADAVRARAQIEAERSRMQGNVNAINAQGSQQRKSSVVGTILNVGARIIGKFFGF